MSPSESADALVVDDRALARVSSASPTVSETAVAALPARSLAYRERRWVGLFMLAVDAVCLIAFLVLAGGLRLAMDAWWPANLGQYQFAVMALHVLALAVGYALVGLYPGYGRGSVELMRRRVLVTLLFVAAVAGYHWFRPQPAADLFILLTVSVLAIVILPIVREAVCDLLVRRNLWGAPVVVAGSRPTAAPLVAALQSNRHLGFVPIAVMDDDPQRHGDDIEGVPVCDPVAHAKTLARRAQIAMVSAPGSAGGGEAALGAHLPFGRVVLMAGPVGVTAVGAAPCDLGEVTGLRITNEALSPGRWLLKRSIDYLLGVPMFILALPILALFGVWIKLIGPGPVFFCQDRVGLDGRPFRLWKLRTMYVDATERLENHLAKDLEARSEWEAYFKLKNDPRVLPGIGHFLRRTSIDELPQLWNILRGEMSLVGPRPFPAYHLARFSPQFRAMRCAVLPGLTGLWQVVARSAGDLTVQQKLDTEYITNWSIWLDLYLIDQTVRAVLLRKNAY